MMRLIQRKGSSYYGIQLIQPVMWYYHRPGAEAAAFDLNSVERNSQ